MKVRTSRMETSYVESGPPIDAAQRWSETFFTFLASVEP